MERYLFKKTSVKKHQKDENGELMYLDAEKKEPFMDYNWYCKDTHTGELVFISKNARALIKSEGAGAKEQIEMGSTDDGEPRWQVKDSNELIFSTNG